jgi:hypothetical protein
MQFPTEVVLHAVKESAGSFEGKAFSSCTFHVEVDLPENGAGRSIGRVTRPFKLGDAQEFDKWSHLGGSLPLKCAATMRIEAAKDAGGRDGTKVSLVAIRPLEQAKKAA